MIEAGREGWLSGWAVGMWVKKATVVLEHHDPRAGGNKWPKAVVRSGRVTWTQPYVGVLLVKVLKPWQWGPKGFFLLFAYFLFLSGDQELISSPISGPQIPHLCNAITLLSCLLPRAILQHLVFYEG